MLRAGIILLTSLLCLAAIVALPISNSPGDRFIGHRELRFDDKTFESWKTLIRRGGARIVSTSRFHFGDEKRLFVGARAGVFHLGFAWPLDPPTGPRPKRMQETLGEFQFVKGLGADFVPHNECVTEPTWYRMPRNMIDGTRYRRLGLSNMISLSIPLWTFVICFACYPLLTFFRGSLRRTRRRRGLCVQCGYNLTGAPEPRCPECGTTI